MEITEEQKKAFQEKLANMSPEERANFMQEIQKKATEQCIFCRIARGEIPARKVFETEDTLAFLDIKPVNPGQVIVIPKKHYTVLPQIPDQELAMLSLVVKRVAAAVFEATNAEGVMITQLNGAAAGQVIPHVHFYVIPRYGNDKMENSWPTQELTDEQFVNIQKTIISKLGFAAKEKPKEEQKEEKTEKEDEEKYEFKPRLP